MRHSRYIGVLLAVLWAAGAQAEPRSAARPLAIEVRDYASIARTPLTGAIGRVKSIFADAGVPVRIRLTDAGRADAVDESADPGDEDDRGATTPVTVLVYPGARDDAIEPDRRILGVAPGAASGGRVAYVFASRIEVLAKRHAVDYGTLLGIVVAHEVGHVLLRGRPHAHAGLMRAMCGGARLKNVILATLTFEPDEAAAIRKTLF